MKKINLYSDGSSLGNPGPGGWGTILEFNGIKKELSAGDPFTTNNKMELTGVIKGLQSLHQPCEVHIISDSKYVVQAINEWLKNWVINGFKTKNKKPIKNYELWQEYLKVAKNHKIFASWVKGHCGHEENERCDILARTQAQKFIKEK